MDVPGMLAIPAAAGHAARLRPQGATAGLLRTQDLTHIQHATVALLLTVGYLACQQTVLSGCVPVEPSAGHASQRKLVST